ncbi:hypothetical protein FJY70_04465, partial [candidate division WOR-3 bacterium]|nr:hypothetical protein [candidate division WOR-3 bacterium]
MKRLVVCVFAMTAAALAVDVSWTGAGGDHSWSNPANWSTGTVPDKHDNVTIPSGTPFCNAPATIELGSLTNAGTLVGNPDPWHGTYLKTD